jgi:1-pyrroline-5-carboxylate dehydrogenase
VEARPTQQLAAHYTMRLLEAAGLPPGVINMVTGDGRAVSEVASCTRPCRHPLHRVDGDVRHLWRTVARPDRLPAYPRLVGETGGKDFVIAHASPTWTCCAPH